MSCERLRQRYGSNSVHAEVTTEYFIIFHMDCIIAALFIYSIVVRLWTHNYYCNR